MGLGGDVGGVVQHELEKIGNSNEDKIEITSFHLSTSQDTKLL